jgi:hypothetical protein
MVRWLRILIGTVRAAVRTHRELALENLALRQQLAVWKVRRPRPRLTVMDRIFWVVLSRLWKSWRSSLQVVRPETVVGGTGRGSGVTGVEESTSVRTARDRDGAPRADSADEPWQSSLGRAEDPR